MSDASCENASRPAIKKCGKIYVYKDNSGTLSDYQLEAKPAAGDLHYSYGFGNNNFAFTEDVHSARFSSN